MADKYYAVDTGGRRYDELVTAAAAPGRAVLEYGCGTGSKAFELSRAGARVVGIDISGVGVAEADARASEGQLDAAFVQMDAEHLGFASGTFDVVCGSGILHHLDLEGALTEVRRLLRPDGVAVFLEPLGTNPVINLYRRLTPSMRTPDEHPLVAEDLAAMRRHFTEVDAEHHSLLSLAGVVLGRIPVIGAALVRGSQRVDLWLLSSVPFARRFAWVVVVRLRAAPSDEVLKIGHELP